MSESKDNHAFPTEDYKSEGLSKAEYAAIHLKVPMSGTAWLDEMIEASRRDEFAKVSLSADRKSHHDYHFALADLLLAASKPSADKRKEGE